MIHEYTNRNTARLISYFVGVDEIQLTTTVCVRYINRLHILYSTLSTHF